MKVLVVLACCIAAAAASGQSAYVEYGVVPDVIDVAPHAVLKVSYQNPERVSALVGNELTPTQVQRQPTFSWPTCRPTPWHKKSSLYTLIFVDTDAYTKDNNTFTREFVHMLIGNIPGNDVSKGTVLFNYAGSGPPQGSGFHRYVYLLYKQPGYINFNQTTVDSFHFVPRLWFSARRFAAKWNLGAPIAANFYRAQYDPYCDELAKTIVDIADLPIPGQ